MGAILIKILLCFRILPKYFEEASRSHLSQSWLIQWPAWLMTRHPPQPTPPESRSSQQIWGIEFNITILGGVECVHSGIVNQYVNPIKQQLFLEKLTYFSRLVGMANITVSLPFPYFDRLYSKLICTWILGEGGSGSGIVKGNIFLFTVNNRVSWCYYSSYLLNMF